MEDQENTKVRELYLDGLTRREFLEETVKKGKHLVALGSALYICGLAVPSEGARHLSATPKAEYSHKIVFGWSEPPVSFEDNYAGSHIYRCGSYNGPWEQLTEEPFKGQYVHETALENVWNYYRVVPMCNSDGVQEECGESYGYTSGGFKFKLKITEDGTIIGNWSRPEAPKGLKIIVE